MEYAPLETIFTLLESMLLQLGCAPLETEKKLPGCAPLEVGQKGEFLVAVLEVGNNGAVYQASLCKCEVYGVWVAVELDLLVQGQTNYGISHGAL